MPGRSHTILLSAERVLPVFLVVRTCWAPELSVGPSVWCAGIVGLSHKDKRKHTWLAIGVATIRLVPHLCTDTCNGKISVDHLVMRLQSAPITSSLTINFVALPSIYLLTPLLTADSIAKAGADHLRAPLAPEPTLSIVEGGSRVCAARSLNWLHRLLSSLDWRYHNSTRGCKNK